MLDQVLLRAEQEDLLTKLVEAARNVPSDERQKFVVPVHDGTAPHTLIHPGLPGGEMEGYLGDVEALASEGLLTIARTGPRPMAMLQVDISPRGYAYYKELRLRSGDPTREIEATIMAHLNGEPFRARYPEAHQKWAQASDRLWSSDSERELTVIGHLCREAMQAFATTLVDRYQPPSVDPNPQHAVARLRAVLRHRRDQLGTTELPFLEALVTYWGTVIDLVQRQEHGAQREGKPLVWEDARRVVFQTANVIFEIDRSLMFSG